MLDRQLDAPNHLLQLGSLKTTGRNGKFTLKSTDTPGKHTYVVQFVPPPGSLYTATSTRHKLTVTR